MDLIFLVILGFIGITGLVKSRIKISNKKELRGTKARILSSIFVLAGIQLIIKDYILSSSNSLSGQSSSLGYLLGTAAVVAVATILFMALGQEDVVNT